MSKLKQVHVTYDKKTDDWKVKRDNADRASFKTDTKQQATDKGRELAKVLKGELFIHNMDNTISNRNSYGNDPCPPKDKKY